MNMKTRKITREITLYVHHTPLTLVRRATHERTILYDENKRLEATAKGAAEASHRTRTTSEAY